MNYDSKKTLNENLQLLNEETTVTGADYLLKLKTPSPGGNSPGTARITKGSKITKNGDFINVDSKDVSYNYNCTNSTFQAISKSGIPMLKTKWNNAIYTSDSKDLTAILDTKFCKNVVVGGGNKGVDNMAGEKYWGVLLQKLKDAGYPFKEGLTSGTNLPIYWFGPFVIYRYGNTFITYKKGADYHNAKISVLSYKGKYAGQVLTDITLVTNVFSKGAKPNLKDWIDYLYKTTEKTKEIPGTGSKKQNEVPPGGLEKNPSGLKKSKGEFIDCTGTYTYGCKSPKIGEAQKCMKDQGLYSYKVDNEFGLKTYDAIKKKLNKTSFTDADVNVICGKKQDEKSPLDFEGGGGSGDKEEDYVWRGEFI